MFFSRRVSWGPGRIKDLLGVSPAASSVLFPLPDGHLSSVPCSSSYPECFFPCFSEFLVLSCHGFLFPALHVSGGIWSQVWTRELSYPLCRFWIFSFLTWYCEPLLKTVIIKYTPTHMCTQMHIHMYIYIYSHIFFWLQTLHLFLPENTDKQAQNITHK